MGQLKSRPPPNHPLDSPLGPPQTGVLFQPVRACVVDASHLQGFQKNSSTFWAIFGHMLSSFPSIWQDFWISSFKLHSAGRVRGQIASGKRHIAERRSLAQNCADALQWYYLIIDICCSYQSSVIMLSDNCMKIQSERSKGKFSSQENACSVLKSPTIITPRVNLFISAKRKM